MRGPLAIRRNFALSEKLTEFSRRQYPLLSRALPALGYLLRCPEGADRAVKLGHYEAPIDAHTQEIDVKHIPHASIMRPEPYRDAVLNFLEVVNSTSQGPEYFEKAFTRTRTVERAGVRILYMHSFLNTFRSSCYPAFPLPALTTKLAGPQLPDPLYQRIIEHANKPDVSWLTTLFFTNPTFPLATTIDISAIIDLLPTGRILVSAERMRDNLPVLQGKAVITGARMRDGMHVMFRGPIHEVTQAKLGFPKPSRSTQEGPWASYDVVIESRFADDAMHLKLLPDGWALPGPPSPREVQIPITDIDSLELTGLPVLLESSLIEERSSDSDRY